MDNFGSSLLGAYGPWIEELTTAAERKYSFLDEKWSEVSVWSREARRLFASHVLSRELGSPEVKVGGRRNFDGLIVEDLEWRLPYGPPTRAYFLKPADASGRLPGIVAMHDHGANKYFGRRKIADADAHVHPLLEDYRKLYYGGRPWANELAKRGYGVLVHDIFPFGSRRILASELPGFVVERMMLRPEELHELTPESIASEKARGEYDVSRGEAIPEIERYNAFAGQYESTIAKSLFCAGLTWPGVVLAEDRAALAYLASRPDVDPDRIGCGGLSGGGLRTNYLAGSDDRVRCSVTAGFMTTWADFAMHSAYTHTWMIYVPALPPLMDYPDILAMRAPLPSLVLATRRDPLFSPDEVRKAEAVLEASYQKAGAADCFRMSYYEGPHRFDAAMQEEAFAWFDRWL
ncbi:MAG: alpha/beta hydrolase family protein [Rectinemataceae bacterium]